MAAPSSSSPRIPSEDIISQKTDLCISNAIVKTGTGFGVGVVLSVLLFKRRAFPVWLGTGFGLGSGYTDCERSFAPVAVPGVRIVPSSAPEKAQAPATTFERLSQKAGESFGALKEKAKDATSEGSAKAKELKEEVASKIFPRPLLLESLPLSPPPPPPHAPAAGALPGADCLSCRLTGAATLSALGLYSLKEAHALGTFARTARTRSPLRAYSLVTFALACFGGAYVRMQ